MIATLERGLERVLRLIAYGGGLVLSALVLLVIYEIFMRYFYGRPFRGGYEITELAMSLIIACGLPYTAITRGHVSVDILARWLDRPAFRWLNAAVHLAGAVLLALIAWRAWHHASGSLSMGSLSNMMKIPKHPFQFAISISAGLFSLVLALETLKALIPDAKPARPT